MATKPELEDVREAAIDKLTANLVFYLTEYDPKDYFCHDTLERDIRKSIEQLYDSILFEVHEMLGEGT